MNCVQCDYLLWDLPQSRCPECGLGYEVTDYSFAPDAVHFVCNYCGQSYLGTDKQGLPQPRKFECVCCHQPLDAAQMIVRPIAEDAIGEPRHAGTPWQFRHRQGFFRGYVDGIARLALSPDEYFRLASGAREDGAMMFSVLSAYVSAALFVAALYLFRNSGLATWLPNPARWVTFPGIIYFICAVPFLHLAWTYLYGLLIQTVLWGLGLPKCEFDASLRAVALGSAVLPAVLLFPPVGLIWYLLVVRSGLEHLHATTSAKALAAAAVPMLLAANTGLLVLVLYWVA